MINKIISGGQIGAETAALDIAIQLNIPHGGWISKGWKAADAPLPAKYKLQEISTSSYTKRAEKNVLDSDGTLIISHGQLTGASDFTKKAALKNKRPLLHIDLDKTTIFQASLSVTHWITENQIAVLNVTGPRTSKDPEIYRTVINILESVYYLGLIKENRPDQLIAPIARNHEIEGSALPRSVDEAVDQTIDIMSLKDKATIANMTAAELTGLQLSLGMYIRNQFRLWTGNEELMQACRFKSGKNKLQVNDASLVIIKEMWNKLRKTHKLRIIKSL
jgi:hypothetical protein